MLTWRRTVLLLLPCVLWVSPAAGPASSDGQCTEGSSAGCERPRDWDDCTHCCQGGASCCVCCQSAFPSGAANNFCKAYCQDIWGTTCGTGG
jgi:hypothetical protein